MIATYERIIERLSHKSKHQIALTSKIFDWTLCVRRPLELDELREAIAVDLSDSSLERSKIAAETDGKRFLQDCGNLVRFDEDDRTVRFTHHTVAAFLERRERNRKESENFVGGICVTYLQFADFEAQIALTNKTPIIRAEIPNQSAFLSIPRLLSISNGVYDFLVGIYRQKTRALPTVDYTELLKKYERKPLHPNFEQRFSLLSYIRENWIWHTMSYDKSFAIKWDQFNDLALYKNLLLESRPWGVSQQPSNLPHLSFSFGLSKTPTYLCLTCSRNLSHSSLISTF